MRSIMHVFLPSAMLLTACTDSATLAPPEVSEPLLVPDGSAPATRLQGSGFQIYECREGADMPGTFAWALKAPEAVLISDDGVTIGTHYAGPTWEHEDGSTIQAMVEQRTDAPDTANIPWLLLRVTERSGTGELADITYIQRVNTVGGKAPAEGCDAASIGAEERVAYTADYYFYAP